MLLRNCFEQYAANFKSVVVFAILLVFVIAFSSFENIFVNSGSMLLDYNVSYISPLILAAEAGLIALFLLLYSFFVSIIVFDVRRNLSQVKLHIYLVEMIRRFTLRIFIFYALFYLISFAVVIGISAWAGAAGFPASVAIAGAGLLVLAASLCFLFVPQAVVIDEEGLRHALLSNFEFLASHPRSFVAAAAVGSILLALLQLLEFVIDQMALLGSFVSLFLALIFVLPFVEVLKTYLYMMRFDIIKEHEAMMSKRHRPH